MDDLDCPVGCMAGSEVVGIRVEVLNDVADLSGGWSDVGEISVDRRYCLVVDPTTTLPKHVLQQLLPPEDTNLVNESGVLLSAILEVPIGRYHVEAFVADDDVLGVRLCLVG